MSEELVDDIEVVSPGQLLREGREKMGWTQQEVATRLNLRVAVVIALESDQYDENIGSTFIRGYLRTYAKLLGISEELIIASYEHLGAAQIQYAEMQSFSRRTKQEAHDNRLMLVTYGIAFILVILSVIWYVQENDTQSDPIATALEQSDEPLQPEDELVDLEMATEQTLAFEKDNPNEQEAPADPASVEVLDIEEIPAVEDETAVEPDVRDTTAQSNSLVLKFKNDCWVSIEDATGERMAFGIKRKGYEMQLDGRPPYQVVLGAPEAVDIEYAGQPFNMPVFKAGQRARLTIPSQE